MAWQLFLNFCIVWNITHAWSLRSVAAVVSCYWFIVSGLGHCFCCLFYPSLAEHSISSRHSTSITTRALFFTMSLIYALLMAALDLAGIIFNLRMLRSCFRDKEKYTFLQKCRTLAICQCACQVLILLADAVDSWQGFETESRESCDVVRVLSSSMLFFQGCNLMAILIRNHNCGFKLNSRDFEITRMVSDLIVHSTTLLNFDWSRTVQLIPNCTP